MNLINYYSSNDKSQILNSGTPQFKNTAFYSLKIALKSYFSTYYTMVSKLNFHTDKVEKISLSDSYYESYIETIVHFQHFFELIIKDLLEKENPLLAVKTIDKPVLLHRLLLKEDITDEEYNSLNSLEFSGALKTVCELQRAGRITNPAFEIFNRNKGVLDTLNNFRNRIWHRGRFILKYHALDEFICKYVLPVALEVVELNEYTHYKTDWSPKRSKNIMKIDVLLELKNEYKKAVPDHSKIAFLKEVGRTEYNQELIFLFRNEEKAKVYKKLEDENKFISEVLECPVCGNLSLLNYHDYDVSFEELGDEIGENYQVITVPLIVESHVGCIICKFEVNKFVKNPSDYGYGDLRFWNVDKS
ncbi:hypothetical protein [Peribacillus frigoritolerans]|uniref:hypothetical protein n=1 Tax=Peribacillus frigoritolerans TaxID=450367 RepID=UPI00105A53AD|nr:hypothetical protein [Peribacillus frigoritolerans]TDL78986.1 hypothetical protein E2R53_16220 [Peribacillus frigoritolerans]